MTETSIYDIILSYYTPTSYIQKIKLMKKGEQFTCTLISFKSKRQRFLALPADDFCRVFGYKFFARREESRITI
jgi:hypothetical protein